MQILFVWNFGNFDNNFGINHDFKKYLKESCWSSSEQHLSFKYFLKFAFAGKISSKLAGCFGHCEHLRVNLFMLVLS